MGECFSLHALLPKATSVQLLQGKTLLDAVACSVVHLCLMCSVSWNSSCKLSNPEDVCHRPCWVPSDASPQNSCRNMAASSLERPPGSRLEPRSLDAMVWTTLATHHWSTHRASSQPWLPRSSSWDWLRDTGWTEAQLERVRALINFLLCPWKCRMASVKLVPSEDQHSWRPSQCNCYHHASCLHSDALIYFLAMLRSTIESSNLGCV